jgi:alkylated DNA repair dioxygenase AlkB
LLGKLHYFNFHRLSTKNLRFSRYFKQFLSVQEANDLYAELYALKEKHFNRDLGKKFFLSVERRKTSINVFLVSTPKGKVLAPRFTAAFGEKGIGTYGYAGFERETVEEWPKLLLDCKNRIEKQLGVKFNYGFVNIYETKNDDGTPAEHYIGWHSDSEGDIVTSDDGQTTIASISLGDERKFQLRQNYRVGKDTPTTITNVVLEHGSLCTMEKHTQKMYKHCVPKKKGATKPRINVTFRLMKIKN